MIIYIFKILILLSTISCSTKISNFELYNQSFLSKSEFIPTKDQINKDKSNIIIYKINDKKSKLAIRAGLGYIATKNIETIIASNKIANIINRDNYQKLKDEITLSQLNNNFSYKGPIPANYAIIGEISGSSFNSKYISSKESFDEKTKKYNYTPPKYKYSGSVEGKVNIIQLPNASIIKTIELKGDANGEEYINSNNIKIGKFQFSNKASKPKEYDESIMQQSINDATYMIEEDIKNFFAPIGYISQKKKYKNKVIFKISLGSNDGIKQNDKIYIYTKVRIKNDLTDQFETETRYIGSAKISNIINDTSSWIVLEDNKNNIKIRLGDIVKIKYDKSFAKKHNKTFDNFVKTFETITEILELIAKQ